MIEPSDFLRWQNITRVYCHKKKNLLHEALGRGDTLSDNADETQRQTARYVGAIEVLDEMLELDVKDLNRIEEL